MSITIYMSFIHLTGCMHMLPWSYAYTSAKEFALPLLLSVESIYFTFGSYQSSQSPVPARLNNSDRDLESPQRDRDKVKVLGSLLHRVIPKTKYSGMSKVPM